MKIIANISQQGLTRIIVLLWVNFKEESELISDMDKGNITSSPGTSKVHF